MTVNVEAFDELIKAAGFPSRRQFALAAGVTPQSLHDRLSGMYAVGIDMLYRYAKTLNVRISDLIPIFYTNIEEQYV